MGFFDFLTDNPRYGDRPLNLRRLNTRHDFLVAPHVADLDGARVLDLAAHDGRWSYALSAAGAREVVGVEVRAEMMEQFGAYPAGDVKERVDLRHGDVFDLLPAMVERGEQFDVVAIFGLYYHLMNHYELLTLVTALGPRLVVVDSEFALAEEPVVRLASERTDSHLNSVAHVPGQAVAPVGVPSRAAMELMAASLGYDVQWADWSTVPPDRRAGLKAYYRTGGWKRRGTCALRPVGAPGLSAASSGG